MFSLFIYSYIKIDNIFIFYKYSITTRLILNLLVIEIIEKINENATNILDGKSFVVSGVFDTFSRDDLKKVIEDNGGKNVSAISAKTDFVVAGDNMGPAKLEKATRLGVAILSETDFIKMLQKT